MRPSFIYHQITALLLIIATIRVGYDWTMKNYNSNEITNSLLLLSIGWGIHSLIHFDEEVYFNFNPLTKNNKVLNNPTNKHFI